MAISEHLANIRAKVGHQLLCLPSVSGIIRNTDGHILLVRNAGSKQWNTPGGIIEPCDRPAESVVREMKEELNLDVKPIALLGVFSGPEYICRYPNGDEVVYVTSVFECEVLSGNAKADEDEIDACQYFSQAELASLNMPPWMHDLLAQLDRQALFN